MSSTPSPLYQPYYAPTSSGSTVGYNPTKDPVKAAQNQRAMVQSRGDQFISQDQQLANEYAAQQGGTQSYLNPIEQNLAGGNGGYSADEASQIELTPQQKQDIETSAGISAGAGTASAVGAAERATAAAGGNPAAMATYRARAAQQMAADAGQAQTGAKVAAQQAGSAGAQAVGGARLAEQNQGLQYFGNLQSQQGGQAQNEQGLGQGAYGTQTQGTSAATGQTIDAAKLPTTGDKIIGGITGALSALADGDSYLEGGSDAVVGEDGPEAIIKATSDPANIVNAASDPIRSDTKFMADGGGYLSDDPGNDPSSPPVDMSGLPDYSGSSGMTPNVPNPPNFLQRYLAASKQQQSAQPGQQQQPWSKVTPYQQIGSAVGKGVSMLGLLADGKPPEYLAGGRTMDPGFHWPRETRPSMPHSPHGGYQPLGYRAKPMLADGGIMGPPTPSEELAWSSPNIKNEIGSAQRAMVSNSRNEMANRKADPSDSRGFAAWAHDDMQANADEVARKQKSLSAYRARPHMADGAAPLLDKHLPQRPEETPADTAKRNLLQDSDTARNSDDMTERSFAQSDLNNDARSLYNANRQGPGRGGYYRARPHMADGNFPEKPSFSPDAGGTPMQAQSAMRPNSNKPQIFTKPTMVHLEKADMVVPLSFRPRAKVRPSMAFGGARA